MHAGSRLPHPLEVPLVRAQVQVDRIHQLEVYEAHGGYEALTRARSHPPGWAIEQVAASGLTGRGGAGFPTGRKWQTVADSDGVAYVVVNGDESEPGAFKDRELMECLPHRILEGALIAAHAVEADEVILFIRGEYELAYERLKDAVAQLTQAGTIGTAWPIALHLHKSAGAYICGEETALIEALEGNRPAPRGKPPYPAVCGFNGRPTLVNNVETLATVPAIIDRGADWYRGIGTTDAPGTRVFSLSGNVTHPGNYELPLGTSLTDLIYQCGGGVPEGRAIKAVVPGGTSTPLLRGDRLDIPLTPDGLQTAGSNLGTCSVVVYDERCCMVDVVANISLFYQNESCGKCTPCREGTHLLYELLTRLRTGHGDATDLDRARRLCDFLPRGSVCALAAGAVAPVISALDLFEADFTAHLQSDGCPLSDHPTPGVRGPHPLP